jgi:hypothetical protein
MNAMRLIAAGIAGVATSTVCATDVFEIAWSTLDGGGGVMLSGDGYELSATVGQPDAVTELTDGVLSLQGGYWVSGGESGRVFCKPDLNEDGFLDFFDYDAYINRYERGFMADYNDDGFVDFFDYDAFVADFGRGC